MSINTTAIDYNRALQTAVEFTLAGCAYALITSNPITYGAICGLSAYALAAGGGGLFTCCRNADRTHLIGRAILLSLGGLLGFAAAIALHSPIGFTAVAIFTIASRYSALALIAGYLIAAGTTNPTTNPETPATV